MLIALHHAQFAQEDGENANGGHILHDKAIDGIERLGDGAVVGQFVAQNLLLHSPGHKAADEEGTDRHQQLGHGKVEEVEDAKTAHCDVLPHTERERTRCAKHHAHQDYHTAGQRTTHIKLAYEDAGRHLEHRYAGGESRHDKQYIGQEGEAIGQHWHIGKYLLEDIGQGDKNKRGPRIGFQTIDAIDSGEDNQARHNGHQRIDAGHMDGVLHEVDVLACIASVGAETADTHREREESLAHSTKHRATVHLREVGLEQESETALDSVSTRIKAR